MSPAMRRPTENMLVRSNNDGTYSCNWTPGATGWYSLHVTIDGYQLEEVCSSVLPSFSYVSFFLLFDFKLIFMDLFSSCPYSFLFTTILS